MGKNLTDKDVMRDIETISRGRKFVRLSEPATCANGRIKIIPDDKLDHYASLGEKEVSNNAIKFVPASGAATRMFKALNNVLGKFENIKDVSGNTDFIKFWNNLRTFPFYSELAEVMKKNVLDIDEEIRAGKPQNILKFLLSPAGLNYAGKPKLFLTFHLDNGRPATAFEGHVKEARWLTGGKLHFTVSPEHRAEAETMAKKISGVDVSFSEQKKSTDTIAMLPDCSAPFRTKDGNLYFRQSGHGALISNLNEVAGMAKYVLIQNVDNLPGGSEKILKWKRAFLGFVRELELKSEMVRPLVVSAMVPNDGEPGGGPFAVVDEDTEEARNEIIEQSQINMNDPEQKSILMRSTHFNPVFLAIVTRDKNGKQFDLTKYAKRTGGAVFIVEKTHPQTGEPFISLDTGLWNGEIWYMDQIFVEMPEFTFCPAKTVLDLSPVIRPARAGTPYQEKI